MRKLTVCSTCQKRKPVKEGKCKPCMDEYKRDYQYRRLYGITLIQYNDLLRSQDHLCAICESDDPGQYRVFQVDHDHVTGRVRGLLCSRCNKGLMHFRDDAHNLERALEYLSEP